MHRVLTLAVLASALAITAASAQKMQDRLPGVGAPIVVSQAFDPTRPDIVRGTIAVPSDEALTAQNRADPAEIKGDDAGKVIPEQRPDQWMPGRLSGTDVFASDGTKVGDVRDVILNGDGSLAAVLIGVGGFLGIGSKEVAVTMDSFEVIPAPETGRQTLRVAMTKTELEQTAEFKRYRLPKPVALGPEQPSSPPAYPPVPAR